MSVKTNSFCAAVFGVDNGSCDTVMVLRADTQSKEIKLSHIDDTQSQIQCAFQSGQEMFALAVLNSSCGLNIEHYAVINFDDLSKIYDIVGEPHLPNVSLSAQCIKDEKQLRAVLNAIYKKAVKLPPYQYPKIIKECLSLCKTNLKAGDVAPLLPLLLKHPKLVWENSL